MILAAALAGSYLPAQQHTTEPPTVIEGPQTPGSAIPTPENTPAQPAKEPAPLSNDIVVRMHQAGLSDDVIVQTIANQPGRFDTDAETLIVLKQAGIDSVILSAMINKARRPLTRLLPSRPAEVQLSPVNEIGVYFKDKNGQWQPMESEAVHIKSGGFIKNTLSDGIIKADRNGVVTGREASLLLPRPIEFLIYTPDGVTASEYELVRFRLNAKDREFRVLTGGVIHSTGGAQRDDVAITLTKVGPRAWSFHLASDTPGAEYGILPPGTGNVTNGGKIYTFAISE